MEPVFANPGEARGSALLCAPDPAAPEIPAAGLPAEVVAEGFGAADPGRTRLGGGLDQAWKHAAQPFVRADAGEGRAGPDQAPVMPDFNPVGPTSAHPPPGQGPL